MTNEAGEPVWVRQPTVPGEGPPVEGAPGYSPYEKEPAPLALERKMEMMGIDPASPEGQEILAADLAGQEISFVQRPDGTVEVKVGKGVGGSGESGLTKPTLTSVEKKILSTGDTLMHLKSIRDKFLPEYQTLGGKWAMWQTGAKAFLDWDVSPEDRQIYTDFVTYRADAAQLFALVLKDLSGVAVNPTELERAKAWLPSPGSSLFDGDDPIALMAKVNRFEEFSRRAIMKYHYVRKYGLNILDVDVLQMDGIVDKRGDELEAKYIGDGYTGEALNDQVKIALKKEFGI